VSTLLEILEKIPDDENVYIVFFDGMEIEVTNCEAVSEPIYESKDYVLAGVVKKHVGDMRFHTPGTMIEVYLPDIKSIRKGSKILY